MGKSVVIQIVGLCLTGFLLSLPALSQELDSGADESARKTQELLKNPAQRNEYSEKNQSARDTDRELRRAVGSDAAAEDVYGLAADIFPELVKAANGDPVRMQEIMAQVHRNPASLKDYFTPEQLERLKAVASQVEKQGQEVPGSR